jgi:hypothetical protein
MCRLSWNLADSTSWNRQDPSTLYLDSPYHFISYTIDWIDLLLLSPAPHATYFWSTFRTVQVPASYQSKFQMQRVSRFSFYKSNLIVRTVFLLNNVFTMSVLDLITKVSLAPFIRLPKCLQNCTFSTCIWHVTIFTGDDYRQIIKSIGFPTFISIVLQFQLVYNLARTLGQYFNIITTSKRTIIITKAHITTASLYITHNPACYEIFMSLSGSSTSAPR